MNTIRAFLRDGSHVEVPEELLRDWQYQVNNEDTYLGLADWYLASKEA